MKCIKNLAFVFCCLCMIGFSVNAQQLKLYSISLYHDKDSIAFVSLSDNYRLSIHPDSLAMPSMEDKAIDSLKHVLLKDKYRKRFLKGAKISEYDKVFIYDYAARKLVTLRVDTLPVVARLNIYADDDEWTYPQEDYMFGFDIDAKLLKGMNGYFSDALVYVGRVNPFVMSGMQPIIWRKINPKGNTVIADKTKMDDELHRYGYSDYKTADVYEFLADGYRCLLQDIADKDNTVFARHLVVTELLNKRIVCERDYITSEGSALVPLCFAGTENGLGCQWFGKLFKYNPPVVFGFEYQSFSCPAITFLNSTEQDLYINCDNRH